tara:strand:+ start:4017 stop:4433 length:417 start_codon:yes stop_codon:yes gene_type:complete
MTFIVLAQVFFRYGLGDALTWSEEASRFLMVWLTFLASPVAYLEKSHIALDLISEKWGTTIKRLINITIHLLSLVLIILVLWKSSAMVVRGLTISAASLPIPMAVAYAAIPFGFFAMLLVNLQLLTEELFGVEEQSKA